MFWEYPLVALGYTLMKEGVHRIAVDPGFPKDAPATGWHLGSRSALSRLVQFPCS